MSNILQLITGSILIGFLIFGVVQIWDDKKDDQQFLTYCQENTKTCMQGFGYMAYGKSAINPPYYQVEWFGEDETTTYNEEEVKLYTPILEDGFSFDSYDLFILIPLLVFAFWILRKTPLSIWKILLIMLVILLILAIGLKIAQYHVMLYGGELLQQTPEETRAWRQNSIIVGDEAQINKPILLLGLITMIGVSHMIFGWFSKKK